MVRSRSFWSSAAAAAGMLVACGSQQGGGNPCGALLATGGMQCGDASAAPGDANAGDVPGDVGKSSSDGGMSNVAVDASDAAALPGPQPTCSMPVQAVNTSQPTTTVGLNGTNCDEQSLRSAVTMGGIIKFYCPKTPTISITQTINLPVDKDTTIDGGNIIALDGGGMPDANTGTRIFSFVGPGCRTTKTTVTLQNIDLLNGYATGTPTPMAPAPCSQGTNLDGGGGAIYIRDGILHAINVGFTSNQAASLSGGAIYAQGSLDVTVVKSRISGNGATNGGGIASVNSDLTLVNDTFSNNVTAGSGASSGDGGQVSSSGNGGAMAIAGVSDGMVTVCGCTFAHNTAGALGGGLFRTADNMMQTVNIDQTWFDTNTAAQGGGAMYVHNCNLTLGASTLTVNSAPGAGGIQANATTIDFVNDTFWGNLATTGSGGAMSLTASSGGTIQSCTFAENHADHNPDGFAAAIAGATVAINDTIFWRNQSMNCTSPMACQNAGNTGQANLQTPANHLVCTDPDQPCTSSGTNFADAMLAPIKTNGGPTRTMLPMTGSPAIGAGKGCPMTDQRGVQRNPGACTIGAVEVP